LHFVETLAEVFSRQARTPPSAGLALLQSFFTSAWQALGAVGAARASPLAKRTVKTTKDPILLEWRICPPLEWKIPSP
jgi:hypothetical protein